MRALCLLVLIIGCRTQLLDGISDGGVLRDLSITTTADLPPPPPDLSLSPPPCGRGGPIPTDAFTRVVYGMAASWRGTVSTPWVPSYQVELDFFPDGSYFARSINGELPLYYDSNPEKGTWEVRNLSSNGDASGVLTLAWLPNQEPMSEIRLNSQLTHLHFTYYHFGQYGPITYELDCSP